jgi:hypothetical protein
MIHDESLAEGRDGVMWEQCNDDIAEIFRRFHQKGRERGEQQREGLGGRQRGGWSEVVNGRGRFPTVWLATLTRGNVQERRGEVEDEVVLDGWDGGLRRGSLGGRESKG